MIESSPNLNFDFIEFIQDNSPEISVEMIYIHWHEMVGEYCIYIDGKWSGYVPEEYIFKSGLENYNRWKDYWSDSDILHSTMEIINTNIRTLVKYCNEKSNASSDYLEHVKYFIDTIRCSSFSPDMQEYSLNRSIEWMKRNNYTEGLLLLEQELNKPYVKPTRIQRTV